MAVAGTQLDRCDMWNFRFAMWNLLLKDFRIRYRNMSLGVLWSILNPLVMLGVLVFVFTYVYPQQRESCFPVFLLLGLIPFNFLSQSLSVATSCMLDNASLIKKLLFPRHILPLSAVLSQTLHLLIQLGLLAGFLLIFRLPVTRAYLWLPAALAVVFVFAIGSCLIFAALHVYFRDVQYLVQSGLTVLFWFTPIFYSVPTAYQNMPPILYGLFLLNPLAGSIDTARRAVLYNSGPDVVAFSMAAGVSVFTLGAGIWIFSRLQANFADHI
jgi:ABC-type polysaccharide/polyol phosphate export permease